MLRGVGGLVRPRPGDTEPIAAMLAAAMARDPLHLYFFPRGRTYRGAARTLFKLVAGYGIRQGNLLATSRAFEGVALWQLPRDPPWVVAIGRYAGAPAALVEGVRLAAQAGAAGVLRMIRASAFSLRLRRRHAPFPHAYLALLAVEPRQQGLGFAGALLRPVLEALSLRGLPCYLETHRLQNVSLYRHFGFQVLEEVGIPGTAVRQWCLLKKK